MRIAPGLLALAAAVAIQAAPAMAATPESGEAAPGRPATWTGQIDDALGLYELAVFFAGSTGGLCPDGFGDELALRVAEGGTTLTVKVSSPDAINVAFELEDPDGDVPLVDEADVTNSREIELASEPGDWIVRVMGAPEGFSFTYTGTATIDAHLAEAAPPAPAQSTPEQSAPVAAAAPPRGSVKVSSPRSADRSARRLKRTKRLTATARFSVPVTKVRAVLTRAGSSRVVGSGSRARGSGTVRVPVRLRRALRPGSYRLAVSAIDEQGRRLAGSVRFRVRR
jgi:hypothetical protein